MSQEAKKGTAMGFLMFFLHWVQITQRDEVPTPPWIQGFPVFLRHRVRTLVPLGGS